MYSLQTGAATVSPVAPGFMGSPRLFPTHTPVTSCGVNPMVQLSPGAIIFRGFVSSSSGLLGSKSGLSAWRFEVPVLAALSSSFNCRYLFQSNASSPSPVVGRVVSSVKMFRTRAAASGSSPSCSFSEALNFSRTRPSEFLISRIAVGSNHGPPLANV